MKLDYEKDAYIDEANLDLEYLEAGGLTMKYGTHLANCRKEKNSCHEKLKLIRSQLVDKANRKPKHYLGLDKPTVATVEAFYRKSKRHQEAKDNLADAEYELEIAQIAFDEIKFRKTAINGLAKLYADNYFAGPAIALDITDKRNDRIKSRSRTNAKVKLGKKRKRTRKV